MPHDTRTTGRDYLVLGTIQRIGQELKIVSSADLVARVNSFLLLRAHVLVGECRNHLVWLDPQRSDLVIDCLQQLFALVCKTHGLDGSHIPQSLQTPFDANQRHHVGLDCLSRFHDLFHAGFDALDVIAK